MCTPDMTRELVIGFVYTEGLIDEISEIENCTISQAKNKNNEEALEATVTLAPRHTRPLSFSDVDRVSYSSCGICGTDNYYNLQKGLKRVKSRHRFSMDVLQTFPARLLDLQPLYRKTAGAHAASLFDWKGKAIYYCEDMGRHNALDKVIGAALMSGISPDDKIVVSSGRASLEMILKAARFGLPVFLAMSRPTSKAVEAAKFYNVTLIDMAQKGNRIYSHVRRINGF
jgi:FdhD protein